LTALKDIRHRSYLNYTRIVVDLDGPVEYESHLLKADPHHQRPCRLYLDLKNTHINPQIKSSVAIKDGLLQRARAGQYTRDVVRVVLDIESIGDYKVFHLYDPFRIVVDIQRPDEKSADEGPKLDVEEEEAIEEGVEATDTEAPLPGQPGFSDSDKEIVIESDHEDKDLDTYAEPDAEPDVYEKDSEVGMTGMLMPSSYDLSGHVAAEGRGFFSDALYPKQERNNASVSLEPEFYCEWENGSSFTFVPFARLDSAYSTDSIASTARRMARRFAPRMFSVAISSTLATPTPYATARSTMSG